MRKLFKRCNYVNQDLCNKKDQVSYQLEFHFKNKKIDETVLTRNKVTSFWKAGIQKGKRRTNKQDVSYYKVFLFS